MLQINVSLQSDNHISSTVQLLRPTQMPSLNALLGMMTQAVKKLQVLILVVLCRLYNLSHIILEYYNVI